MRYPNTDSIEERTDPEPTHRPVSPNGFVVDIEDVDRTHVAAVGGKGAQLGELSKIGGVAVPAGFCVTTDAFRSIVVETPSIHAQVEQLARMEREDLAAVREISAELRASIERTRVPDALAETISSAVGAHGARSAFAVRSSATAEDLPTASFAGQQDSYLNVIGAQQILEHLVRCWASLFTERAVVYRMRRGIDHRKVDMAVIVQRMVIAQASGVLFTADPVTGNRRVVAVEATLGLGASLASGTVDADGYRVRDGEIVARTVAAKQVAVRASPQGGTREESIEPARQEQPALSDEHVLELASLGRRIEAHFGGPQDIEWCLDGNGFQIVQSRPITTLYPVPETGDGANRVYVSVGHPQMMTDPMTPLGLSLWQLTSRAPMHIAGGRLFVDVTPRLSSPADRHPRPVRQRRPAHPRRAGNDPPAK